MAALQPETWCTSIDLQDAFFHVPVAPRHRHFLRFYVRGQAYQFKALPFGLGTSPYVFTRVVKAVGAYVRQQGLSLIQYLDDWILSCSTSAVCKLWTEWLVSLVRSLGLLVNIPKSDLNPSQLVQYIGILFDLIESSARPADHRVQAFLRLARQFLKQQPQTAEQWQRVLGHMTSLEKLVPRGRLQMRPVQFRLSGCWSQHVDSPFKRIHLDEAAKQALLWWSEEVHLTAGVPLRVPPPDLTLFTDASTVGWGAHIDQTQAEGLWTATQRLWHINNLELWTVLLALKQFQPQVQNRRVLVMTDNTTVVGQVRNQGGTHSRELYDLTRQLFNWADDHGVTLVARHIPGHLNVIADRLSRRHQVIQTEWSLAPAVTQKLWQVWGQPHVDMFATLENAKLPTYVSPLPDGMAWKIDALSFSWENLWMYMYPPTPLIAEILVRIADVQCEVVLVAPAWPTQAWFPQMLQLCTDQPRSLPLISTLLRQPGSKKFHEDPGMLCLHAWRLSGPLSRARDIQQKWRSESQKLTGIPLRLSMTVGGGSTVPGVTTTDMIRSIPLHLS